MHVIACHFQNNLVLMLQFFVLLLFFAWHTGIPGLLTQVLDAELWKLDSGHWTLDAGLRTLDSELWTLDSGCWTLDAGRWTLDSELWTLDSGRWTLGFRRYTLWTLSSGYWTPIVDCFRTKSEASFRFCLTKLLKIVWVRISKDLMVTLVL